MPSQMKTTTKTLEWIYHILKDGRSYQEMERIADLFGGGEVDNHSGSV